MKRMLVHLKLSQRLLTLLSFGGRGFFFFFALLIGVFCFLIFQIANLILSFIYSTVDSLYIIHFSLCILNFWLVLVYGFYVLFHAFEGLSSLSILLTTVLNFVSGCLLASISFSSISGDLSCYFIWNLFLCLCILAAFLGLFLCTVIPWYLSAIELVKPCICCILTRKIVSALSTCSGLITFPRNCMSHDDALQEKMLHCSVLIGFGTHHGFWSELTGTEVPLCSSLFIYLFIYLLVSR